MFGFLKKEKGASVEDRLLVLEQDAALAAEKIEYLERKLRVRTKQLYNLQQAVDFIASGE